MPEECRVMQGNVWKWVQSVRGMPGNAGNARGMYGSGCKVAGKCRAIQGNARKLIGLGVKCKGDAGDVWEWVQNARRCRGMQGNARGMQGNAREYQCNVWEWVQRAREMQGNAGECHRNVWEWVQRAR